MLAPVVPPTFHNLASVRLVLLDCGVGKHSHVVVHVEIEQRTRLSAGLGDEKRVECVVLRRKDKLKRRRKRNETTHMRNDEIFLKTRS